MRVVTGQFIRFMPPSLFGLLTVAAGTSPSDATSHLAAWYQLSGHTPPVWLARPSADHIALIVMPLLMIVWLVLLWVTREHEEAPVPGDSYNNSGNANYGAGSMHVGDVHNHAPPQPSVKDQLVALLDRINPLIQVNINCGNYAMKIEFPDHIYHKFIELIDNHTGRQYVQSVQPYGSVMGYMNEVGPGTAIRGRQNSGMATQAGVTFTPLMRTI